MTLGSRVVEDLGRGGVLLAEALSKSAIDAVVLLLVGTCRP
jgi:hypothetical protein